MKDPFAKPQGVRLKPLQVAGIDGPIDLRDGGLTLGRADDNDVVLPEGSFPSVSNHHLRLDRVGDELVAQDLGSRNGTLVNGERIERRAVKVGDVLQLGAIGPRFVVVSAAPLSETMFVDPRKMQLSESEVEDLVRRRARRQTLRISALLLLVVALLVWWGLGLAERGERIQEESAALVERLREEYETREVEHARIQAERAAYVAALQEGMERSEQEAKELRARLVDLEESGASSTEIERLEASLDRTRSDLRDARGELAKYDPINLEAARLSGVASVREAVVLIEATMTLEKDGEVLHLDVHQGPNWDGAGKPWTLESTGTGFVVSPEGYVLTNRHVVEPPQDHALGRSAGERELRAVMELYAVFNGRSQRHALEVVELARGEDLALVKLEPFSGMPHVQEFSTDVPPPPAGSDVYLLGFPLGNFALQEGRRVIASTFRGILSRVVDGKLQVDAGVHPGNSGGPITDPSGRVIGVVVSVQATPEHTAVYTIGYGVPIERAEEVWPPARDGEEVVGAGGK